MTAVQLPDPNRCSGRSARNAASRCWSRKPAASPASTAAGRNAADDRRGDNCNDLTGGAGGADRPGKKSIHDRRAQLTAPWRKIQNTIPSSMAARKEQVAVLRTLERTAARSI